MRSRRVGPATFRRLISAHEGSAEAALAELPGIARAAGVDDYAPCPVAQAQAELEAGHRAGAWPVFLDHPDFPILLADQDDAPPMLWVRGDLALAHRPAVALVGARNASSLGLRMARSLAGGLGAAGLVTVSGLARGIDGAVHKASLETGTIAVLAGGVDVVYPPEHDGLLAEIAQRGLVVSEMPPGLRPQARHFPRRNRIIAGLGRALVVVEAAARSGSLITARDAADLGRDVLAVPGHPFDARASGCNMLIRDGATLVRGPDDVHTALGLGAAGPVVPEPPATDRTTDGSPVTNNEGRTTDTTGTHVPDPALDVGGSRGGGRGVVPSGVPDGRGARLRSAPDTAASQATSAEGALPPCGAPPHAVSTAALSRDARAPASASPQRERGAAPVARAATAKRVGAAASGGLRARILSLLGPAPIDEDALCRDIGGPRPAFAACLTDLEMDGEVHRAPGGLLSRAG